MFVTFEGVDWSGKSTQAGLLAGWLGEEGRQVLLTREPGGTPVAEAVRDVVLHGHDMTPWAEAALYAAARADHVEHAIRPALDRGEDVVCDRYIDSSVAYQGAGRVLPAHEIRELSDWATDGLLPQLTVLLDIDPAVGLRRFSEPADRIESESLEFHHRVRTGFLDIAAQRPDRYLVIDATLPQEQVFSAVRRRVLSQLPTAAALPPVPLAAAIEER
jgi:dTMP kinase